MDVMLRRVWILAGDIGGTKTELSLFERLGSGIFSERCSQRFPSQQYADLPAIVTAFFAGLPDQRDAPTVSVASIRGAAFGVAGPVQGRTCKVTNLPWLVDADALQAQLSAPTALLNDFTAVALGVGLLHAGEQHVLQEGAVEPDGPVAILGAGTGLGEAVLVPGDDGPRVLASEGGHADLAPRNPTELRLLEYLWNRHERVSVERVVSGLGLRTLFEFVTETGLASATADTLDAMQTEDVGAVIGERGQARSDPACAAALDLFVDLYGAEAGNLALKVLPTGGLYVAGGIAPRLLASLSDGRFLAAMTDKGRMRPLLEALRVSVVLEPRIGVWGAAHRAAQAANIGPFQR